VEPGRCTARPGGYRDGRYVLEDQPPIVL
jgi:hypothetical protein